MGEHADNGGRETPFWLQSRRLYLIESVYDAFLQELIAAQIRQRILRILHYDEDEE